MGQKRFLQFLSTLSLRRATNVYRDFAASHPKFLSTLSLRRATCQCIGIRIDKTHFYPRSPCGERRFFRSLEDHRTQISIHALLAESDPKYHRILLQRNAFLSTLSLRRATSQQPAGTTSTTYFYPRSPCGERPSRIISSSGITAYFYPRSPCGERLSALAPKQNPTQHFYPRSPCGERLKFSISSSVINEFLSTLSLRRATLMGYLMTYGLTLFLSTLSLRRATLSMAAVG